MPTPRESYTNTVERQGYSGARLQPADFGSAGEAIGRAVQGFGQDLKVVADEARKMEERDAETAAREADNLRLAKRLKRFYGDPEKGEPGFFNREGKNALLDHAQLTKDLQDIDREAAELLRGKPLAERMFKDLSLKRDADDMPRIAQFLSKERTKHEDAVDDNALDLALDNAASSLDPAVIEENIKTAGNIAVRKVLRSGNYDENAITQARQAGEGQAVAAVAEQLNLKSPSEAQAFVVLHAKRMDPQDAAKLLETLAPSAAKEQADEQVGNFLVLTNDRLQANPTAEPNPVVPGGRPVATPMPDEAALDAAQFTGPKAQEGAASHTDSRGRLITSPAGAEGVTQLMPGTQIDPGYGVVPPRDRSRAEFMRAGRDYRKAMLREYDGNIVLALTAYNWGPGKVNKHLRKVGDPRKGEISDAAFLSSIPKKEAREYAELVLGKAGVRVGGGATPVDPSVAQAPTYQGQEINLVATFAKIDASDLTYMQKQALKDSASRQHALGRQARAEAEDRLKDAVWAQINPMGDGFTSYDQLSLSLRQQLATNPQLEAQFRNQAETNERARLARIEARDEAARDEAAEQAELDLMELEFGRPEQFLQTDLRTLPGLTHADRVAAMRRQEQLRKSRQPGQTGSVDHDRVRREINKFAPHYQWDPKKPNQRLGQAYTTAIVMAQNLLKQNGGKPLNDAQVEGIARTVMMPVRLNVKDSKGVVVPRFEMGSTAQRLGRGRITGAKSNIFNSVKADIQTKDGYTPSDAEVHDRMRQLGYLP